MVLWCFSWRVGVVRLGGVVMAESCLAVAAILTAERSPVRWRQLYWSTGRWRWWEGMLWQVARGEEWQRGETGDGVRKWKRESEVGTLVELVADYQNMLLSADCDMA